MEDRIKKLEETVLNLESEVSDLTAELIELKKKVDTPKANLQSMLKKMKKEQEKKEMFTP